MASNLVSVNLLICEKALMEQDGIASAIRIVDVFFFTRMPEVPLDKQAVSMTIIAIGRFSPSEQDRVQHTLELYLTRPSGERKQMGEPAITGPFQSKIADAPGGFNIIAAAPIIPREMGVHYVVLMMDGKELARTAFTMVERTVPQTE